MPRSAISSRAERINATSVMVVPPSFHRIRGKIALQELNVPTTQRAAIGLHLTLTAPFCRLSEFPVLRRPQRGDAFRAARRRLFQRASFALGFEHGRSSMTEITASI